MTKKVHFPWGTSLSEMSKNEDLSTVQGASLGLRDYLGHAISTLGGNSYDVFWLLQWGASGL